MKTYITIDGGTTNTRLNLVIGRNIKRTIKLNVGAKKGIESRDILKQEINKAVSALCAGVKIDRIIASGMITSEFGLYNLPHIPAPAGIRELHNGIHEIVIKDICDTPIVFIPGVIISDGTLAGTDMMRGEETELFGLSSNPACNCLYILPGSHSKIIRMDNLGRIASFITTLTGEMVYAAANDTILKDAVDISQNKIDDNYLIIGYNYCEQNGLNESLFKVRILKNIFSADLTAAYSFFIGAILHDEVKRTISFKEKKIVIGGKKQLKDAMVK